MLSKIPTAVLELYAPATLLESLYLKTRWRLCPFRAIESLVPPHARVLDFGCGYGMLANFLALSSPARSVVGIDLNRKRIAAAKRSTKGRRDISFHCGSLESFHPIPLDAVVMTDVLHHMDDAAVERLLTTIHSSLRGDGILLILDVDRRPAWKFLTAFLIDRVLNPASRLWYRPLDRTRFLLEKVPFAVERVVPAHAGLPLADVLYVCRKGVP